MPDPVPGIMTTSVFPAFLLITESHSPWELLKDRTRQPRSVH